MTFRGLSLALGFLVLGWGAGVEAASVDRISEWEPSATEAWAEKGFRIQLRFGTDSVSNVDGRAPGWFTPEYSPFSFTAEPGIRLSCWFSVSASLRYSLAMSGIRWSNTADLSFHLFHGLYVAAGVGYGGVMGRPCEGGGGLVTIGRAAWLFPLGQVFATGPAVQWEWQDRLRCGGPRSEKDRSPRYDFGFRSSSLGWTLAWR